MSGSAGGIQPAVGFRAGTPEEAPPAVLAVARERLAPTRKAREAIIDEIVASDLAEIG